MIFNSDETFDNDNEKSCVTADNHVLCVKTCFFCMFLCVSEWCDVPENGSKKEEACKWWWCTYSIDAVIFTG